MNNLFISIFTLLTLLAIGHEVSAQNKLDNGYSITGELKGAAGAEIYLIEDAFYKDVNGIDSAIADKAGKFFFKGKVEEPTAFLLRVKNKRGYASFILENAEISITGNADSIGGVNVTGSKENDINKRVNELSINLDFNAIEKAYENAISKNDTEAMRIINLQYQQSITSQKEVFKTFISSYPTAYASVQLLSFFADLDSLDEADSLLNMFKKVPVSNSGQLIFFQKLIESRNNSSAGKYAPDFIQPDTSGKLITLSSFKGKYVLLDFWASWCLPCRKRNPDLVNIFKKYSSKNFTIISVSLDEDRQDWLQAIIKDNMTWINVSDLKAGENTAKLTYGVFGIPANYLIAPDGKIIAKIQWGFGLQDRLEGLIR